MRRWHLGAELAGLWHPHRERCRDFGYASDMAGNPNMWTFPRPSPGDALQVNQATGHSPFRHCGSKQDEN